MSCAKVNKIIKKFDNFTEKPVKYLNVQAEVKDSIKEFVKSIYDYTKTEEGHATKNVCTALPKLIVEDFDEEQIWQQIELQNIECLEHLISDVANCITIKDSLKFPLKYEEDVDDTNNTDFNDIDSNCDLDNLSETIESDPEKETVASNKSVKRKSSQLAKRSEVDDDFFKLSEMEQFLLKEEQLDSGSNKKRTDSDEESVDMFEEEDDVNMEEDEPNIMYSDFFNGDNEDDEHYTNTNEKHTRKQVRFADIDDDASQSDDNQTNSNARDFEPPEEDKNKDQSTNQQPNEKQSEFEQRQSRLKAHIAKLENKAMTDAPWQLKGEVIASKRPQNSLLQEVIDFDLTTRPAPIITEKTTYTLEDIINRRIKDKVWDDVVKKAKPVEDVLAYRKAEIIDQSKSKLSLAQIYEADYLKQKYGNEDDEPKEPESHVEIREAMSKLFSKLDALCHYHYTPKPSQPDIKIVSNIPAIAMEEVAPVATSDATLLAPEEIKRKRKGELTSKEERTNTDKNRERRKKKKLQKEKGKFEKKEVGNFKKAPEVKDVSSYKTSKAFFQHLNDDVNSVIKSGKNVKRKVNNKGQ